RSAISVISCRRSTRCPTRPWSRPAPASPAGPSGPSRPRRTARGSRTTSGPSAATRAARPPAGGPRRPAPRRSGPPSERAGGERPRVAPRPAAVDVRPWRDRPPGGQPLFVVTTAHWASDVVLVDGGIAPARPIQPADAPALIEFHDRLAPATARSRFFGPEPRLDPAVAERFAHADHDTRVVLLAEVGGRIVGAAGYERDGDGRDAEVAFVVADEHQGRGIGTILLEHLAAAARERGITRFVAEAQADNRRMLEVFSAAGFAERTRYDDRGTVHVELAIEPTDIARAAIEEREHRAEARSVARLLTPRSGAVIGASRNPANVGHQVLRNLLAGGFAGPVYPVNPGAAHVASVKAYPSVLDVPDDVDLAVVAVPAPAVLEVVEQCAAKGVSGLVVLSAGFGEVAGGEEAQARLRDLA